MNSKYEFETALSNASNGCIMPLVSKFKFHILINSLL